MFVPVERWPDVRDALSPLGIEVDVDEDELRREGQIQLKGDSNLLHLFFSCDPLHEEMRSRVQEVPFGEGTLPLIAPEHLIIRKALLGRPKDRSDIERILASTPVDQAEIESWVNRLAG